MQGRRNRSGRSGRDPTKNSGHLVYSSRSIELQNSLSRADFPPVHRAWRMDCTWRRSCTMINVERINIMNGSCKVICWWLRAPPFRFWKVPLTLLYSVDFNCSWLLPLLSVVQRCCSSNYTVNAHVPMPCGSAVYAFSRLFAMFWPWTRWATFVAQLRHGTTVASCVLKYRLVSRREELVEWWNRTFL